MGAPIERAGSLGITCEGHLIPARSDLPGRLSNSDAGRGPRGSRTLWTSVSHCPHSLPYPARSSLFLLHPQGWAHTHTGPESWLPLGFVLQGGKLSGYLTGTRISLWKISPGSNRWLIPWALSRKSVSKLHKLTCRKAINMFTFVSMSISFPYSLI